jgi:hypothetical protein
MAKTLYVDSADGTRLAYGLNDDGLVGNFGHETIWKMPPGSL